MYKKLSYKEKVDKCEAFFNNLQVLLWDSHNVMESCNNDISAYLVPSGTENQVSYKGKPANSFRISDHWNWYSNLRKNSDPNYIQCHSVDLPNPTNRLKSGKASIPIKGIQVSLFGNDDVYHCVYGEYYSKESNSWEWLESDPMEIVAELV